MTDNQKRNELVSHYFVVDIVGIFSMQTTVETNYGKLTRIHRVDTYEVTAYMDVLSYVSAHRDTNHFLIKKVCDVGWVFGMFSIVEEDTILYIRTGMLIWIAIESQHRTILDLKIEDVIYQELVGKYPLDLGWQVGNQLGP